jgi:hypothetical protein
MDATTADTPGLGSFVKSLAEEGRAEVGAGPLADDSASAPDALRQLDEMARAELGIPAPPFSAEAALWAARLFYHLCQFTVCRDIGEERIKTACGVACPEPRGPTVDWSADLTLRHLPRLFQFALHLSNADPLVQQMRLIAAAWPLSSVGIAGLVALPLDSFITHTALRRLYADRVIAQGDLSRLGDAQVDDLLRADLGMHRELAPAIAEKLFHHHDPH